MPTYSEPISILIFKDDRLTSIQFWHIVPLFRVFLVQYSEMICYSLFLGWSCAACSGHTGLYLQEIHLWVQLQISGSTASNFNRWAALPAIYRNRDHLPHWAYLLDVGGGHSGLVATLSRAWRGELVIDWFYILCEHIIRSFQGCMCGSSLLKSIA